MEDRVKKRNRRTSKMQGREKKEENKLIVNEVKEKKKTPRENMEM